jgi:hypothetical protein
MKVAISPSLRLADELVVDDHFRNASIRQAADEGGAPDILVVNPEAQTGGQQDPERRQHPKDAILAVGGFQNDHGETDILPVLGSHALHQRTLFGQCAGRLSQRICQSPWDDRTSWAAADSAPARTGHSSSNAGRRHRAATRRRIWYIVMIVDSPWFQAGRIASA